MTTSNVVAVQGRISGVPPDDSTAGRLTLSRPVGDSASGSSRLTQTDLPLRESSLQHVQAFRATPAWAAGIRIFNTKLTKDKRKRILVTSAIPAAVASLSATVSTQTVAVPRCTGTSVGLVAIQASAPSPFEQLIRETRDAAQKCGEKKTSVQKKLEFILSTLNRYAQTVDVLIQAHPDTTAIAWGAIRMLVTVAVSDQNTSERLSTALADIVDVIGRCEDYQNIYPNAVRLEIIISRLYAEVINFLVRSKKYYESVGAVRVAKSALVPFDTKFGAILERIEKFRQEVRDEVQLLTSHEQGVSAHEQTQFRKELISYIGKAKHNWLVEEQLRQDASEKRDEALRSVRYWLDATHFDHLRREKHWQDGTCEWIMQKPEFSDWLSCGSSHFWIYGIPGCGKTVMSTFLQDRLTHMGRPIIQFFCKNDEESKRRPALIVATLLSQLLDHPQLEPYQYKVAELITKEYNKYQDISKISMDKLCELLQAVASLLPPLVIIIDALDECEPENLSRGFLIEKLIQLGREVVGTKIIFTSRQEEPFLTTFESCKSLEMSKDDVSQDIEAVVREAVEASPKLRILKDKVISGLLQGANGMFLWAELMLTTLKKARNRNAVEKMLANLPIGLRGVFEHILISIGRKLSKDELDLRREILGWVTTAARPMTLEELSVALAIETGADSLDDGEIILRLENDVRELCGPMLSILDDRTVRVVHMSVRDMFHGCIESAGDSNQISLEDQKYLVGFTPSVEHARLASGCVTYLALKDFREQKFMSRIFQARENLPLLTKEHILLEYATSHWVYHISNSGKEGLEFLALIADFLQSDNAYSWIQLMTTFNGRDEANFSVHILQRSKLLDWAKNAGSVEESETAVLNNYLLKAIQAGARISEVQLGPGHLDTLKALVRLGCLYDHEDRLEEARTIQQKVVDLTVDSDNPEAQQIFNDSCIELAYNYRVRGDYTRSIELLELVLGGPDPSCWSYDRTSAEAMADLGVVYRLQRNFAMAREMAEKGAEGLAATLGPNHLLTLRYTIQLCRTYFESGSYDEAQTLLEKVLKTAEEVIGPEESVTLHGRDLLGNILHARGELDSAEDLLRDVLRLMKQQWGENGRSTALLRTHVADVLVDKAEWRQAIELYQAAIDTYEGLAGVEHPDTHTAAVKLTRCYTELGMLGSVETVMVKYRVELGEVEKSAGVTVSEKLPDLPSEQTESVAETRKGQVLVQTEGVDADMETVKEDVKAILALPEALDAAASIRTVKEQLSSIPQIMAKDHVVVDTKDLGDGDMSPADIKQAAGTADTTDEAMMNVVLTF